MQGSALLAPWSPWDSRWPHDAAAPRAPLWSHALEAAAPFFEHAAGPDALNSGFFDEGYGAFSGGTADSLAVARRGAAPQPPPEEAADFLSPWLRASDAATTGGSHPFDQPMKIKAGQELEDEAARTSARTSGPKDGTGGQAAGFPQCCRWHKSAETVGVISEDGHVFTKTAGPRRSRMSDRGARVELASLCMVFDQSLRSGGTHRYCYRIMAGELGAADGAGFVFDSKVRRTNIQRMRSVFLNQRGRICLRNNQQVTKLQAQLPPLTVGVTLTLAVDLDAPMARFSIIDANGEHSGSADVSLEGLFDQSLGSGQLRSGFFCAVVTGDITVGLQ